MRCTAGDADCHGLQPRNDGGYFALVLLIWLCNCPTESAWWCSAQRIKNPMIAGGNHTLIQVPHALQKNTRCSHPASGVFVDIFAGANSIYGLRPFDIAALRYDLNPLSPRRAYRVAHISNAMRISKIPQGIYIEFYTVTRQPLGSSRTPVWMPVMVS